MADKELKAEIKKAKATNKLMKKVNKYTTQSYGIIKVDVVGATLFIGNNTFVRTYRLSNTKLTEEDKERLIQFLCDKWKGHVRLSIINTLTEDQKRAQMIVLTVYFMAVDYYNALFDIEEFESMVNNTVELKSFGIAKNNFDTTIKILKYIFANPDNNSISNIDFVKKSWKNIVSQGKDIDAKRIIIETLSDKTNLKEMIQKHFKSFVLSFEIKVYTENEIALYQRYINKRYGIDPKDNKVNLEFSNLCGISVSISTDADDDNIDALLKEANDCGFVAFYDKDNKRAYLNDYMIGIKDAHILRLYDPSMLIEAI